MAYTFYFLLLYIRIVCIYASNHEAAQLWYKCGKQTYYIIISTSCLFHLSELKIRKMFYSYI